MALKNKIFDAQNGILEIQDNKQWGDRRQTAQRQRNSVAVETVTSINAVKFFFFFMLPFNDKTSMIERTTTERHSSRRGRTHNSNL